MTEKSKQRYINIPVFVPHVGCPNDCVFCNQKHITSQKDEVTPESVERLLAESVRTIDKSDNVYTEIAFFGGSFTGIDEKLQTQLLSVAYKYVRNGTVKGIRLSTRPDYINRRILDRLLEYGVTTVELGVQSMDDTVLALSERGHTASQTREAARLIKTYPFKLGLQMMVGLYGDTKEKSINTARELVALEPDCVRVYPTLVLKDTKLADFYACGSYTPLSVDEAVETCKQIMYIFNNADIPVIRMGLMGSDEISLDGSVIAGPFHDSFGELVQSSIFFDRIKECLKDCAEKNAVLYVNPADVSKAVGNKKSNISGIKKSMGINIKIKPDSSVEKGSVCFEQKA